MSTNATGATETALGISSVQRSRDWTTGLNDDGILQISDVKGNKHTASRQAHRLQMSKVDSTAYQTTQSNRPILESPHDLLLDMLVEDENKIAYHALLDDIDGLRQTHLQELLKDDSGAQAFAKKITNLCGCDKLKCLTAFCALAAQFVMKERYNATISEIETQLVLAGAHLQSACDINQRYLATIENLQKQIAMMEEEIELGKKTSVLMRANNDMLAAQRNTYQNHAETLASLSERLFIFDDKILVSHEGTTKNDNPVLHQLKVQENGSQELAKNLDGSDHKAGQLNEESVICDRLIGRNTELKTLNDRLQEEAEALRAESTTINKRLALLNQIKHENVQLKKKLASANTVQPVGAKLPSASKPKDAVRRHSEDLPSSSPSLSSSCATPALAPEESFDVTAKRLLRKIVARGADMVRRIKNQSAPTGRSWQAYQMAETLVVDVHAQIEHDVRDLLRSAKSGGVSGGIAADESMVLDLTEDVFPALPGRHGSL